MLWYLVAFVVAIVLYVVGSFLVMIYKGWKGLDYYRKQGARVYFDPIMGYYGLFDDANPGNKSGESNMDVVTNIAVNEMHGKGIIAANIPNKENSAVFIYNSDIVKDYLINENDFSKTAFLPELTDYASFFYLNGEPCFKQKAMFSKIFSFEGLDEMYPTISKLVENGFRRFCTKEGVNNKTFNPVNLDKVFVPLMATIGNFLILGEVGDEVSPLINELNNGIMEVYHDIFNVFQSPMFLLFPNLSRKMKLVRFFQSFERVKDRFMVVIAQMVEEREKKNQFSECILDRIILHNRKCRAEGNIGDIIELNNIVGAYVLFYFAGTDTTMATSISMLCLMSRRTEIKDQLLKICGEVYDKEGNIIKDQLENNDALDRFVKESLRIFPPLAFQADRIANKDIKLGNFTIRKGDSCYLLIHTLHRDSTVFNDPLVFDTDRFLKDSEKNRPKYQYVPFTLGKRVCLGRHLGTLMVKLLMTQFVRNYEFECPSDANFHRFQLITNRVKKPILNVKAK